MFYQTNCTQSTEMAEKMSFLSLVTLTFKLVRARDQTRLPYEYGASPFSGSRYISYTNKNHRLMAPKQTHSSLPMQYKMPEIHL